MTKSAARTGSLRELGKKRSGGQAGHKGQALVRVSVPEHVVEHRPLRAASYFEVNNFFEGIIVPSCCFS